jgi:hypothetical protein
MTKSVFFFTFCAVILTGCQSEETPKSANCIRVKYLRGICGQAVLQLQEERHYSLGETVGNERHVFLGTLECGTNEQSLENKIIYIEIEPEDFNTNCAVCLAAIDYAGNVQHPVRVVGPCTATEE